MANLRLWSNALQLLSKFSEIVLLSEIVPVSICPEQEGPTRNVGPQRGLVTELKFNNRSSLGLLALDLRTVTILRYEDLTANLNQHSLVHECCPSFCTRGLLEDSIAYGQSNL